MSKNRSEHRRLGRAVAFVRAGLAHANTPKEARFLRPFLIVSVVCGTMPPRMLSSVAFLVGFLLYLLQRDHRAVVREAQRGALGERASVPSVERATIRSFGWFVRYWLDKAASSYYTEDERDELMVVEGLAHLKAAHEGGQGVVLASAHFGMQLWISRVARAFGEVGFVVVRMSPPVLERWQLAIDRQLGCDPIVRSDEGPFQVIREVLSHRGSALLLVDYDVSGNGVPIRFLGREVPFAPGPAVLARKVGAPIVPCVVRVRESGQHVVSFAPALRVDPDAPCSVEELTQAVASALEELIGDDATPWQFGNELRSPKASKALSR
ncbi:MAG: lysophospholipid acyltransferase family protein [Acidimicrobiales bacterium]